MKKIDAFITIFIVIAMLSVVVFWVAGMMDKMSVSKWALFTAGFAVFFSFFRFLNTPFKV